MKMRKAFTLVEIMIVVAIIAIILVLGIPNYLRARQTAAESKAQTTLRAISTACENYASANDGAYPNSESCLTTADPKFLTRSYCGLIVNSYTYDCTDMSVAGYTLTATGTGFQNAKNCTIITGGVLTCT